ncbi:MAG: UDP-N-acetylmuramoyl-tripeptide--D-alanyl-D-alanine ligase, partial [Planctomycetes bacterium]|nr:UDP-N-acetylmuramoyl-tripeptide--D-alanyl-D-alanine ligase [Planctomycetota bacterium]
MKPLLLYEVKHAVRAELKTPLGKGLVKRVCTDSRQIEPEDLFIALHGDRYDGHDYIDVAIAAGARAVMIDRNIPVPEHAEALNTCVMKVNDTTEALGLLARFYRRSLRHSVQIIAVTGSNGKTTTREMIYHTLSKFKNGYRSPHNYNNQIGVPLTLLGIDP